MTRDEAIQQFGSPPVGMQYYTINKEVIMIEGKPYTIYGTGKSTPGIERISSTAKLLAHIKNNRQIFIDATDEDLEGGFDLYTAPSKDALAMHLHTNVYTKNKDTIIRVFVYTLQD